MKKVIIAMFIAFAAFSMTANAAESSISSAQVFKQSKKAKAEIKEVTFLVHLHCGSCVKKIQENMNAWDTAASYKNIAFEKGVKDLKVSLEDQTVMVKYDSSKTSEEVLKNAIVKLGVPVKGKK